MSKFGRNALLSALSNPLCSKPDLERRRTVLYLHGYLKALKAKTIVVEKGYTDADFLDDYASYYVRCWTDYERHCKRIHFFSRSFNAAEVRSAIVGASSNPLAKRMASTYLGFVVARPLPDRV